ncbi:hypothetical protein [Desulfobulbus alkaliphilus]|uniref:hypothetical protein n=1 Tax=Desulfobulbus alkaliphilus TaxID=869814 RepID=UPI00196406E5|nr:hypothetical protein [Desulfobulbus alkaliphilus]MBM9536859.1 hypothetical protein [Desulfobulbus alkaliphilus]
MQNVEQMLSLEIKKEMADRYFGFRKLIEEDRQTFDHRVGEARQLLEKTVGVELVRVYFLLHSDHLIHEFFRLTGLRDSLFFTPKGPEDAHTRHQLFSGLPLRGLTRRARFRFLFLDTYTRMAQALADYEVVLNRLREERDTIAEEIKIFYRKNDLSLMMGFMRGLNGDPGGETAHLSGDLTMHRDCRLEQKMLIEPPPEVDQLLPPYAVPPPLKKCKKALVQLIDTAFAEQGHPEVRSYVR